jgi:uncharacterized protein
MARVEDRKTVHQYPARSFHPGSLFWNNAHVQTIVGSGALSTKVFGTPPQPFVTREVTISTPDDDFFVVEFTENFEDAADVVVIVHGLESNAKSSTVSNMTCAALQQGFGCCLYNFRGCHGSPNNTIYNYHIGFTADIHLLIDKLANEYPQKRIFLSGFSLGGNVLLKFLGELGDTARVKGIHGAAVFCVPFDPAGCQRKIDVGINRLLYSEVNICDVVKLLLFR